jgi:hypothetical protein
MKTKLAFFWAIATIPAFSNPAKPENTKENPAPVPAVNCQEKALTKLKTMPVEAEAIEALVAKTVTEFPTCSCEIVKAVIEKTEAEPKLVGRIVRAAIVAAPERMRLSAQCAIAVAPDALAEVQGVLASLEANAGESGKSAKSGKDGISSKDGTSGTDGKPGDNSGNTSNPNATPDILMDPARLPIGTPGGTLPSNSPGLIDIPETTPVDPPIIP